MATFFGEVILPSSRAFFDDFEDEDIEEHDSEDRIRSTLVLHKHHGDESTPTYDTFIVSDGPVSNGFTHQFMLKGEGRLLAEVEVNSNREDNSTDVLILKPNKPESTKLYLLSNNSLLLQISGIDIGMSNSLTLLLSPWLKKSKRIVSIVSRHITAYRCDSVNELPPAFVRGLTTSSLSLPGALKHLEQPNFISNVPASVLGWCEGQGKPGLMIVLYSDQEILDAVTISPLMKALSDSGLSQFIINKQPSTSFSDPLKNMDRSFMYM